MSQGGLLQGPYKGLVPYSEEDAPFFFGREGESEVITANLLASRLTLVYGASGVGKSSVLRAGVVHHLQKLSLQNLEDHGSPEFAVIAFSSWRDDPVHGLTARVHQVVARLLKERIEPPAQDSLSLMEMLEWASGQVHGDLLIILDQFEEYFLYHAREEGNGTFAIELPRAVNRRDLRASFLISIREDALAKLDRFKGRIPNLFDNYLRIEHLDADAARQAIGGPIKRFQELYPHERCPSEVEPELVDAVLSQVSIGRVTFEESGRGVVKGAPQDEGRVETPFLQLVMARLWDEETRKNSAELRLSTLKNLGGAKQIVQEHLDDTLSALPASVQDTAARVFQYLVTRSGNKIAYPVLDLAGEAGLDEAALSSVMEKLSSGDARILRHVGPQPGQPDEPRYQRFEIFHDVLASAILDWRARFLRTGSEKRAREEAAKAEREAARQRALRTTRIAATIFALLLFVTSVAAIVAIQQRRIALSREVAASAMAQLSSDSELSLMLAREATRASRTDQAVDALQQALMAQRQRAVLRGHTGAVNVAMFSPNGRLIVTAGADGLARVWDVNHRKTIAVFTNHTEFINSAAFSPDSEWIVTTSDDRTVRVWEAQGGRQLGRIDLPNPVQSAEFSPDGSRIATIGGDDTVRFWEARTRKELIGPPPQTNSVTGIAFSPDGKLLAIACDDNVVGLWEVEAWRRRTNLVGHSGFVNDVSFSPDSQLVVTASDDHTNRVWRATNGQIIAEFKVPSGYSFSAVFSPNAKFVLTAGEDRTARVFDLVTKETVLEMKGHDDVLRSASYSPDGKLIVTASADGTAQLWEAPPPYSLAAVREFQGPIYPLAFAKDTNLVVAASKSDLARVSKSREPGAMPRKQIFLPSEVTLAYSPDHQFAVMAVSETSAKIRTLGSGSDVILAGHTQRVASAAFSSEGRLVATVGLDGRALIWNSGTGQLLGQPESRGVGITSAAFSPDSKYVVTAGADGIARVWSVSDERSNPPLRGHAGGVTCAVFSPDGSQVATASMDRTARLWDPRTGLQIGKSLVHDDPVNCAAFHPDGQSLLTGADDGHIRRWSLAKHHLISTLRGVEPLASVLPTPDGHGVVSMTKRGLARIHPWEIIAPVDDLIALADKRVTRQLTPDERRRYLHER